MSRHVSRLSVRAHRNRHRKGNIVVITALMMVTMVAMLAFACDLGYVLVARTELQRTADAAALASAWELLDERRLLGDDYLLAVEASARDVASSYTGFNDVRGAEMTIDLNASNHPQGDIVIGRYQSDGKLSTLGEPDRYNAVRVRVQRSSERNGPVTLFFARIFGRNSLDSSAEAIATFADGITGFHATEDTGNTSLLPFAIDVKDWHNLLNGAGSDEWTYNPKTKVVSSGSDGLRELSLFPDTQQGHSGITPGNFGTVDIGSADNSSSTVMRQIRDGVSSADLAHHGGELKLDSTGKLNLDGDTGVDADLELALDDIIGQPRTIPLYSQVVGNGDTANYTIVAFVGVRVLDFDLHTNNKYVRIQPALVIDDAATSDGGQSYAVYQPVILSR